MGFPTLSMLSVAIGLSLPQAWPQRLPDVSPYPRPVPVITVGRAGEIPRLALDPEGVLSQEAQANEAVRVGVMAASVQPELFGAVAPEGQSFLVLATRWENIHPRQLVDRASLEGRADRTMGVSTFSGGGSGKTEYVEADVAYQVPRLLDHIYVLTDGAAVSLHTATKFLPGGADPEGPLNLPLLGSSRSLSLAFLVPAEPEDIALQFFDYNYGNILVPVRGDPPETGGESTASSDALHRIETDVLDIAATGLSYRDRYQGEAAPEGWRFAVVTLQGQSKSEGGGMSNIVQFDPLDYAFIQVDGGFLRYATGGSVDASGNIRFTPEVPQRQELGFLVAADEGKLSLGLRLRNEVVTLNLTDDEPEGLPRRERAKHQDGDVLEIDLYGARQEGGVWIVDLGLRPLVEGQGLEIQPRAQFLLQVGDTETPPDMEESRRRRGGPPEPFTIPPGVPVRFELVFPVSGTADGLRFRGFRSEGVLEF